MDDRFDDAYVPDSVPDQDLEYFDRGGHGARIGWGDSPALVVVDMTDAFVSERSEAGDLAVDAAEQVLAAARDAAIPIVFLRPDRDLPEGYRGTTKPKAPDAPGRSGTNEFHERLSPREDEAVIEKPRASGFFDTHLANMLHEWSVDTTIVCGISTSGCVRATVVDAHSSNFNVIVPQEATMDRSQISHEISLFDMDMKYADVTPVADVVDHLESQKEQTGPLAND
jgi:nicotinamidase-related amidase